MIDQFEQEHPLKPSQLTPPAVSARTILTAVIFVFVLIFATLIAVIKGNPAPTFSPLHQNATSASPTP